MTKEKFVSLMQLKKGALRKQLGIPNNRTIPVMLIMKIMRTPIGRRIINPTTDLLKPGVNPNLFTISVEVVNNGEMPPWRQWISWARGCKDIMDRNGITIDHVVNHYEIQGNKRCPRPWFTRFYLQLLLRFI